MVNKGVNAYNDTYDHCMQGDNVQTCTKMVKLVLNVKWID